MSDRSLSALIEFLEYMAAKGLANKNTISGRKAAVSRVLGVLDPEEVGDVTSLDMDDVMNRFINLQGKEYKPDSLGVYRSRVGSSIDDFKRYLDSPQNFRSGTVKKAGKVDGAPKRTPSKRLQPRPDVPAPRSDHMVSAPGSGANVFPVPIRPNVVVRIHGLPYDLTPVEAEKIANVVKAMAMVPE